MFPMGDINYVQWHRNLKKLLNNRLLAETCEFPDKRSGGGKVGPHHNLRNKLLEKGFALTLKQITNNTRALEDSERQAK